MRWGSMKWMSQLKQESSEFILPLPSCPTQVLNKLDETFCFSFICKCMIFDHTKLPSLGHSSTLSSLKCSYRFLEPKKDKENSYWVILTHSSSVSESNYGSDPKGNQERWSHEEVSFGTSFHLHLTFVFEGEQVLCIRNIHFREVREWDRKILGFQVTIPSWNPGSPALYPWTSHLTSLSLSYFSCKW